MRLLANLAVVVVFMWSPILLEAFIQTDAARDRLSSGARNAIGAGSSLVLLILALWIMRDDAFGRARTVDPRHMAVVALPFLLLLWYTLPARGTGRRGVDRDKDERSAFNQFAIILALLVGLFYVVGPWLLPGL